MKRQTLILTLTKNLNLLRILRNRYQVLTLDSEARDFNESKVDRLLRTILPDLIIVDAADAPLAKSLNFSLQIRRTHDIPLLMLSSDANGVRRIDLNKSSVMSEPVDEKGLLAQIESIFSRNQSTERLAFKQAG